MDFTATGWLERNYKWLVAFIIIIITIFGVLYYISLEDKSDTFIAASIYALFLFTAGGYMSYMSNKIADNLQDRIEIYLNLQRVYGFFSNFPEKSIDYDEINRTVISFKVFTSRTNEMEKEEIAPYIKQRGVIFDTKELEIEDFFLERYSILLKSITDILNDYIKNNNISISCRYISIHDISSFIPELWCKEHLSDYDTDGLKMIDYIYDKLSNLKDEYSNLELLAIKISKLYNNFFYRAKMNIRQIEKMYGRKLQYIISQQREIQENFDYLFKNLKEIEERIVLQIEEHDSKIENYVECLENISVLIDTLNLNVDEIKDIVLGLDH